MFETLYKSLNPAQKQAVDTIEGPVVVIAGPGTGKTTVLTLRIANILRKTDIAPENILALTFTESGASAMRRKLTDIIGPRAYKVNIHTFHGFAGKIIEKYPDYFPRIIGSAIVTEAEKIKIIEKAIKSNKVKLLRPYGDNSYYVAPILREIQVLKRENISPARLKKGSEKMTAEDAKSEKQKEKNLELAFVYAEYEKALAENKYYDFEDMLLELIKTMESDSSFKVMLQEEYQYILADEHQDANASQNRILELLADFHASPNLFIVGDDKQAIYRFQGASLDNFLYFSDKYKDAVVIDLEHNYRSHQGILDASHSLISNNPTIPGRDRKNLISLQVGSTPIFAVECTSYNDELACISELIEKILESGSNIEEIAILYRENGHAKRISAELESKGIIHKIESDYDVLSEPETLKIIALCEAIDDPSDSTKLAKALLLPEMSCDPGDITDAYKKSSIENKPLYKILAKNPAYKKISEWSGIAQTMLFPDFLHKIIQETNMTASILKSPDSVDRLNIVQSLYDYAVEAAKSKKDFLLRDFIEYINIVKNHGIKAKREPSEHIHGVRLMTSHRAKGLEFDHVIIAHAVDGIWGNRSSRNLFTIPAIEHARNIGRIEDERRLFYVAMTRARRSIHITYHLYDGREKIPSQFLAEIDAKHLETDRFVAKQNVSSAILSQDYFDGKTDNKTPEPLILEKDFIKAKFLAQPLSVTHLNNYLECPWKYFFMNLIRIPQSPSKHQMYGTAVHGALRVFFDAYKNNNKVTAATLVNMFKKYMQSQPMGTNERKESIEKGKNALAGYFENYKGSWNKNLITEYVIKGLNMTIEGIGAELELTGKLDKVEFLENGNVAVIDYKTGKPKSRNFIEGKVGKGQKGAGDYKRQLVFYKLLTEQAKWSMEYGEIDFIEPNERGNYKKERFEVTDDDVTKLRKNISDMAKDITNADFANKRCGDDDCEYCRLADLLD